MRRLVGGRAAVGVGLGVVLLLAGLAGCSAPGGAGAATTTSGQQDAAAVWRELVRCARANGTPNPPASVRRACQSIYDRLPPSARDEAARPPADMQALLRYARCMREHGVADFPDPDAEGNFRKPAGSAGPDTPGFERAMQACRQLDPNQKGR